jgi:multidrug resistance efflux pump
MMDLEQRTIPVEQARYVKPGRIPIPGAQRWKEFRLRVLPLLVFLLTSAVVFQLWSERVAQQNVNGVVVGRSTEIRSPAAGYLTQLGVDRFEHVLAGDVLGQVVTTDPRLLEARLAVVLAEVELLRLGAGAAAGHQRTLLNQQSLEMDLMRQRIELTTVGLRRQQAERELQRIAELHGRGFVTDAEHERARSDLEILVLDFEQRAELIDEMRGRLGGTGGRAGEAGAAGPIAAEIRRQAEELRLIETEAMPAGLVAPIEGMVSRVFRSNGERVGAGEPVLLVQSTRAEYIVGYLPQPLRSQPEVGMPVVIRSSAYPRREFRGRIVGVGAQMESMEEVELVASPVAVRTGLPIKVALAEDTPALRAGELVQLALPSARREPGSGRPGASP